MKSLYFAWRNAVRAFFVRRHTQISTSISGLFSARPALKRGLLVFCLYCVPAAPLAAIGLHAVTAAVAAFLLALFLGMAAERASLEWNRSFSLPRLRAFCFWRWERTERTRFYAVLIALTVGQLLTQIGGHI
ncbi:MAG: hypothetical protein COB37_11495 [Kordiimonadales bacterium]|nr:MAG: hypothetical protein COB37_11495 [Kordiimonadales bacterium]